MSGVSFGSTTSFRNLSVASTPGELCEILGGKRVINRVIDYYFELIEFKKKIIFI
jgi:hypothetical protein